MSYLLTLQDVSLAFGLEPLLDQIKLQIAANERICLIGRNGAGKSSLLKLIEGIQLPDSGIIWRKPHLRIARLSQELPHDLKDMTVYEYVAEGLSETGKLLGAYHHLTMQLAKNSSEQALQQLAKLQQQIDAKNGWHYENTINTILQRLDLPGDKQITELSGGWQRRAALAQALVAEPELLLLDEPTNHLDINAIQWLEDQIAALQGIALLFITHDRALLQRLATRIIELDRGHLTSWPGDYANFLRRKAELLQAEETQNALFDKKLAEEERWIRQGIKARRTRNEGRVRALKVLRAERAARRELQGKANFNINKAQQSGQLVIEAQHVTHTIAGQCLIDHFNIRIMRGDRIALIGPNGIGKSTLLKILLKEIHPEHGQVQHGTQLQVAYFDQLREHLDLEKTVIDNVALGSNTLEINGQKRHVIGYLGDFLFSPARALTPVKALSGGERNRLLLARLFSRPANLLILDEPTNDLDIETLELLEELLSAYPGTLLLVSHDRTFVENIVTSTWVFQGQGKIVEYIGGYNDWLKQSEKERIETTSAPPAPTKAQAKTTTGPVKLKYKEQQELQQLPALIERLEQEYHALQQRMHNPEFYKQDASEIVRANQELERLQHEIETAYQRWQALEK